MHDTEEGQRKHITSIASDEFRDHVLFKLTENTWECRRGNSFFYGYRVAILPGAAVIWGDLGSMIVDGGEFLALAKYIDSRDYFLSKCSTAKRNHFWSGDFKRYILDYGSENHLQDAALEGFSEAALMDYIRMTGDAEAHDAAYGYDSEVHWLCEALKKFAELHDAHIAMTTLAH